MNQPAKSPDFNVLDLGYFSSIQSLQNKERILNTKGLVTAVQNSFLCLSSEKLEDTFLTFQKVLECALDNDGGNQYKLPHVGKKKLRKENKLPITFRCDKDIFLKGQVSLARLKQESDIATREIAQMYTEDKYYIPQRKRKRLSVAVL